MKAVGLKVLKNRLSEYVRMAARGEIILVTDRDHVVAELTPPRHDRSAEVADALLAEVVRKGWVGPPTFSSQEAPPRIPAANFKTLTRELDRDRTRPVNFVYLDTSVALAEDRVPSVDLWKRSLISSRLLESEVWNRIHSKRLARPTATPRGRSSAESRWSNSSPRFSLAQRSRS
jgi:antitoxin (DNA-binding transcriptional repressor) of toxin-antitoxin stability system